VIWCRLHEAFLTPARERYGPENWDRAVREATALNAPEAIDMALADQLAPLRADGRDCPSRSVELRR
jgi:hypothetical protein